MKIVLALFNLFFVWLKSSDFPFSKFNVLFFYLVVDLGESIFFKIFKTNGTQKGCRNYGPLYVWIIGLENLLSNFNPFFNLQNQQMFETKNLISSN